MWMRDNPDVQGPFIVWVNHGYEGWTPKSYTSLKEALEDNKYSSYVITRPISYTVAENV